LKDADLNLVKTVLLGGSYREKQYLAHDAFTKSDNHAAGKFEQTVKQLAREFPYLKETNNGLSLSKTASLTCNGEVFRFPDLTETDTKLLYEVFCVDEAQSLFELLGFQVLVSSVEMLVASGKGLMVIIRRNDQQLQGTVTAANIDHPLQVDGDNWLAVAAMAARCADYFEIVSAAA
jgi:hypothetical protein